MPSLNIVSFLVVDLKFVNFEAQKMNYGDTNKEYQKACSG